MICYNYRNLSCCAATTAPAVEAEHDSDTNTVLAVKTIKVLTFLSWVFVLGVSATQRYTSLSGSTPLTVSHH